MDEAAAIEGLWLCGRSGRLYRIWVRGGLFTFFILQCGRCWLDHVFYSPSLHFSVSIGDRSLAILPTMFSFYKHLLTTPGGSFEKFLFPFDRKGPRGQLYCGVGVFFIIIIIILKKDLGCHSFLDSGACGVHTETCIGSSKSVSH